MPVSAARILSPHLTPAQGAVMRIGKPVIETPATGWDAVREELWVPYTPYFDRGQRRDLSDMPGLAESELFAQDERVLSWKGGFPVVELLSLGWVRPKEKKFAMQAGSEVRFNDTNNGGWPHPNAPTWPSVTCEWLSLVPLNPIIRMRNLAAPEELFGLINYPLYSWVDVDYPTPYSLDGSGTLNGKSVGWFLERTEQDMLPGCRTTRIIDYYLLDYASNT
jgi:hypothetical protein